MAPTIRVNEETYREIEKAGIRLAERRGSAIGITPEMVIRDLLSMMDPSKSIRPTNPSKSGTDSQSSTGILPSSSNSQVQRLLTDILAGLEADLGPIMLTPTPSGKWISRPDNFFTLKIQDARSRDIAITVYGKPEEFTAISGCLKIKKDMASYSRFNVAKGDQVRDAINVICASASLKQNR